jgi:hypothetical protein
LEELKVRFQDLQKLNFRDLKNQNNTMNFKNQKLWKHIQQYYKQFEVESYAIEFLSIILIRQEIEEGKISPTYIDTINGIIIYYTHAADYYYFYERRIKRKIKKKWKPKKNESNRKPMQSNFIGFSSLIISVIVQILKSKQKNLQEIKGL